MTKVAALVDFALPFADESLSCDLTGQKQYRIQAATRFWSRVNKTDGCWLWTGGKSPLGYGRFASRRVNGVRRGLPSSAHRHAWIFTYGPIPDGLWVCHRCDNPPCVRPDHLFLGTPADNARDCASKGRFSTPARIEASKVSLLKALAMRTEMQRLRKRCCFCAITHMTDGFGPILDGQLVSDGMCDLAFDLAMADLDAREARA